MTVKTSISLTDQQEAFARSLVECGQYPSLSAVLQHGLEMLRAETERRALDLETRRAELKQRDLDMEALRAALLKRADGPFAPLDKEGQLSGRIVAEARAKYGLPD